MSGPSCGSCLQSTVRPWETPAHSGGDVERIALPRRSRATVVHWRRSTMRLPLHARAGRLLVALVSRSRPCCPAQRSPSAADPLVLKVGTDQDLQVLNPWNSVTVADFEVFTLNYDLLVELRPGPEPVPGLRRVVDASATARPGRSRSATGMKWSDGQPATSEDARWTFQTSSTRRRRSARSLGQGYLEPYLLDAAGMTEVSAPDPETLVVKTSTPNTAVLQAYVPILPKHIWSKYTLDQIGDLEAAASSRTSRRSSGPAPTRPSSGSPATSSGSPATRTTGARRAPRTRSSSSTSRAATPWSRR